MNGPTRYFFGSDGTVSIPELPWGGRGETRDFGIIIRSLPPHAAARVCPSYDGAGPFCGCEVVFPNWMTIGLYFRFPRASTATIQLYHPTHEPPHLPFLRVTHATPNDWVRVVSVVRRLQTAQGGIAYVLRALDAANHQACLIDPARRRTPPPAVLLTGT